MASRKPRVWWLVQDADGCVYSFVGHMGPLIRPVGYGNGDSYGYGYGYGYGNGTVRRRVRRRP